MPNTRLRDTDFLYVTSVLRSREAKMLSPERINRMLDADTFENTAKLAEECGYRDMSNMGVFGVDSALSEHRAAIFKELASEENARAVVDLFRMKYDYHNVKALVKSMGANTDATHILSESGRIDTQKLTEAFISGERGELPQAVRAAIHEGVSVLSRTKNPQLSDIAIDQIYFNELSSLSKELGSAFITGYVRLLTDSANLRTFVRSQRTRRSADFLRAALIPGGSAGVQDIFDLPPSGEGISKVFEAPELETAVSLAPAAMSGGAQTLFERACDNASMHYLLQNRYVAFGSAVVLTYLTRLEWEITTLRMILTGKLTGIAPEIIRERLRDAYV
ncbi:MAG: V-type ATPase subunit [Clostridiales bacterium]|nr:V-type ATPase subunit [Clostridiales bacterium]